jgi:hypothetical protein
MGYLQFSVNYRTKLLKSSEKGTIKEKCINYFKMEDETLKQRHVVFK